MSRQAVLEVKRAEEQAQKIIDNAYATSKRMINEAETSAERSCEDFEATVRAEYKASVEDVRREVQEIVDKNKADDQRKYNIHEKFAQQHINDAVKIILQGVMSECQ